MIEEWRSILEFTNYDISNLGNVWNRKLDRKMSVSCTNHGHAKITLTDFDGKRYTRSVALLVAEAFVDAPNLLCDTVMLLDGDLTNVRADNLAWRPQWFAWKYTRQLKQQQPRHYNNLAVMNTHDEIVYDSIMHAAKAEGLLAQDIWESTYRGKPVFPYGSVFEIVDRV